MLSDGTEGGISSCQDISRRYPARRLLWPCYAGRKNHYFGPKAATVGAVRKRIANSVKSGVETLNGWHRVVGDDPRMVELPHDGSDGSVVVGPVEIVVEPFTFH